MKKTRILILRILSGVIITLTAVVYASNTFNSKDISYTNENTEVNNVSDAVDELYDKSSKYKNIYYLSDVVSVGDYVAYDAGSWTETKEKPTSQGEFGGYIEGQNKANSVECYTITTLKGWQVYSIDKNTKTVTLIHAGHPECYYHEYGQSAASVTNLNNRANTYLNSNYANSAHIMTRKEALQNTLQMIGSSYWLATAADSNYMWAVAYNGDHSNRGLAAFGVRPLVILKSNILTAGKGMDYVGQEAWTLIKP